MSPTAAAESSYTPIFDWDAPSNRKVLLGGLIAGSALLHALCFYLFQIIYPPIVALLPPPARVSIINGNTEEGRLLLQWIEAEDPALASTTVRPPGAEQHLPPSPQHQPSYLTHQPALKEPPPHQPDLRVPSPQPPAAVPLPRRAAPAPAPVAPTMLTFATDTQTLGAPEIPPLQFTASTKEPPAAAQFRVAIGPAGEVRYCFVQSSSGDTALDEQAHRQILLTRFPAREAPGAATAPAPLLWTTAIVQWGSDITPPGASATTTSPAP